MLHLVNSNYTSTIESKTTDTGITVEILENIPNAVMIKTVMNKSTGKVSVMSIGSTDGCKEKSSPFDTFAQIIEGNAEIVINKESHLLLTGRSIVIPANTRNFIRSNWSFKMVMTTIGNEF